MNILLGFGKTETDFEAAEECAIRDYIRETLVAGGVDYFTAPAVQEIETWVKGRAASLREKGEEYKNAEDYPERYTYYWATVVHDANHLVVILSFFHINRRHAMSSDGWGLWQTERLVHFNVQEDL